MAMFLRLLMFCTVAMLMVQVVVGSEKEEQEDVDKEEKEGHSAEVSYCLFMLVYISGGRCK